MRHTDKSICYESVANSEGLRSQPPRWQLSHAERITTDRTKWTYKMKRIYAADAAAAEGNWDQVASIIFGTHPYYGYIRHDIKCDDILSDVLQSGIWHWRLSNVPEQPPFLDDLLPHIHHQPWQLTLPPGTMYTDTRPIPHLRVIPARILHTSFLTAIPLNYHTFMTAKTIELYAQVASARLSTIVPTEVPIYVIRLQICSPINHRGHLLHTPPNRTHGQRYLLRIRGGHG